MYNGMICRIEILYHNTGSLSKIHLESDVRTFYNTHRLDYDLVINVKYIMNRTLISYITNIINKLFINSSVILYDTVHSTTI